MMQSKPRIGRRRRLPHQVLGITAKVGHALAFPAPQEPA